MKEWIRHWLGLDEIDQHLVNVQDEMEEGFKDITLAMGRVVAKLDPAYAQDPHSKETLQASDKIGEEVIKRLKGEHEARNKWDPK